MRPVNKNIALALLLLIIFSAAAIAQDPPPEQVDSTSIETTVKDLFQSKSENDKPENFEVRSVDRQRIDSLKKLEAFWYADSAFQDKKNKKIISSSYSKGKGEPIQKKGHPEEEDDSSERTSWLNTNVFLIILVLAFAAIIFFLVKNNVVGRKPVLSSVEAEQPGDSENIFDINYQKEIDKAIAEKNYRLATRLMFLRVLKLLATKNMIQYKQERTNLDYLVQLHSSKYYNEFFRLTRNYEYVWYGKFDPSPETFVIIRNEFEKFDSRIN
jgi:hypothetical protein